MGNTPGLSTSINHHGRISIDLNPPPLVEDPGRFYRTGVFFLNGFFIFFHVGGNEAKEHARAPLPPARRPTGQ